MPRYDYILFDADHTLFDFDRAEREALHRVLRRRGYPLEAAEARYLALNRDLWARFDRGEIRREVLIVERFARLAREFGRTDDPEELNLEYLTCLGEGAYLSLFAMSGECRVTETGVEYPLEDYPLSGAYPLGVSNQFTGEAASVSVRDGALLVMWEQEDGSLPDQLAG